MPLLLCDLDDTLVDRGRVFRGWARGFAQARQLTSKDVTWLTGLDRGGSTPREDFWATIKQRLGLTEPVEVLVKRWATDFPALYRCDRGVLDMLTQATARGWSLGIVTNGDADVQARKLAASGLDTLVDAICISGAEGVRKPDSRLFRLAAERAGAPLPDGWMIGDNPQADIAAARAVGLRTVWLSRGRAWPIADFVPDQLSIRTAPRWVRPSPGPSRHGQVAHRV